LRRELNFQTPGRRFCLSFASRALEMAAFPLHSEGVMTRWTRALGLVLVSALVGPPAPRHAAAASGACSAPEYRQFDFWLGQWEVRTPDGKHAGTNSITRILGGCVLQEHWSGVRGMHGTSFNIYDGSTGRWHQTWVDDRGTLLTLDGQLENSAMVLRGETHGRDGTTEAQRITWSRLANGRVRQLWESSRDGGGSWHVVFDGTYIRRG
jgi:hypothetical protein